MPHSIARQLRSGRTRFSSIPSTPRRRNTTAAPPPETTDPHPAAAPVTPRTAPATGTREGTLRGMPTFTSASSTTRAGLVPVRTNELNLRITPIRLTGAGVESAGLSAAFFTEAATGTEADVATTALRSIIQSTIVAKHPEIPLHAYFPSGPGALTKEIDGRTRKHTGTYILRIAKAYAMNFINLFKAYASITGDGVELAEANLVVRVVDHNRCACDR